jgi:NitT/TauT family transport system ATP-binding protein
VAQFTMSGPPPAVALRPGNAGRIAVEQLGIGLGAGAGRFEAIQDISLHIEPGEFVCLLGPSGCGKSTLLSALAGHLPATAGKLELDGVAIRGPDPQRGLVFQHHTLFPWKSVLDNVAFGLKMKRVPRHDRYRLARQMLEWVGLTGSDDRYPAELSGGMQQRVEIARALINSPRVLLMDEPFGALDALTRVRMQELLLELWTEMRTTVLFVTHDIEEALFLADRIVVMSRSPGRIVEELVVRSPRPRSPEQLADPAFLQLKRRCLSLLHPNFSAVAERQRSRPLGTAQLEGV